MRAIYRRLTKRRSTILRIVLAFACAQTFCHTITNGAAHTARPSQEWQAAAGNRMEFEVASIRPADPSAAFIQPSFALNNDDTPIPPGGRFFAEFPMEIYIDFAYKVMPTQGEREIQLAHAPAWVSKEQFVIQAKAADGNPTKDQMRLMMQSLLAERCKLVAHFERRELATLALVLSKPGKLGAGLRHHSEGLPCDAKWAAPAAPGSPSTPPGAFMQTCESFGAIAGPNRSVILGARSIPLNQLAAYLGILHDFGRPVLDDTGLDGTFDFSLGWIPEQDGAVSSLAGETSQAGPNLLEALKEQLGLKLKPEKAPLDVLVIDHVERPSPN